MSKLSRFPAYRSWCDLAVFAALAILSAWTAAHGQPAQAQDQAAPQEPARRDLSQASIEDLMNIRVTSVSKTEQTISQAAAAIYVITQEDIRRSGAVSIPDLLRVVPGLDVAQIDASTWAVSARGFNQQFTNKLLVLIDGRAVYTPLLGGVNWDTQDVPLEDIDRIEVIRGPGASVWGANAVNGVINIVTKRADQTQGVLFSGGGGSQKQAYATMQYGCEVGTNSGYRVFAKYLNRGDLSSAFGGPANDGWHMLRTGFRADSSISSKDSLMFEGDLYTGDEEATIVHVYSIEPPVTANEPVGYDLSGGNILGRWKHQFLGKSDTTLQFYFDSYSRGGPEAPEARHTIDFDFSHHFSWGSRQDVVWGLGYRRTWNNTIGTVDQTFVPANTTLELFNAFVQDTITLAPERLFLTVGTKVENSYYTGYGVEPSIRLAWAPTAKTTVWSAVSRAERTPTSRDTQLVAVLGTSPDPAGSNAPVETILYGNPQFLSEHLLAYEAGYRAEPSSRFSLDVSTFFNRYDHLESLEPGVAVFEPAPAPARFVQPITFGNLLYGNTEGGEIFGHLKLAPRWLVSPGYAFLEMHLHTKPYSGDTTSVAEYQGSSPQHQAQLRSHVNLPNGLSWDANAYFVSALPVQGIASYTRLDSQLRWQATERGEFAVVGQNLLHDHVESNDQLTLVNPSLIVRSIYFKFSWQF